MDIRLIVPNCNRNTTPIVAYGSAIAKIAGGFTATQGTGGWIDDQGNLVVEPVTVFDCHLGDTSLLARLIYSPLDFHLLARRIGRDLKQDCVYLAINGKATLVKPD